MTITMRWVCLNCGEVFISQEEADIHLEIIDNLNHIIIEGYSKGDCIPTSIALKDNEDEINKLQVDNGNIIIDNDGEIQKINDTIVISIHKYGRRSSWTSLKEFLYKSDNNIKDIHIISKNSNDKYTYDVRIYDKTHNNVICEINDLSNRKFEVYKLICDNLPNEESIFELQVRSSKNNIKVYIDSITIKY